MKKELFFTARTVELAVGEAALKLGISTDALEYEIVEREKVGFLGIGSSPAKIKVLVESEDELKTKGETNADDEAAALSDEAEPETIEPENETTEPEESVSSETSELQPEAAGEPSTIEETEAPELTEKDESEQSSAAPARNCGDHAAKEFIETLLKNIGVEADVEMTRVRKSDRAISITGADAGVLIGHHGDTLDALQYLANLAANKREEDESRDYVHITVDIENYRSKREVALRSLARRMADKVIKTEKPIMLEPMNPYERRIIHSEIQNIEGVSTNSVGADSDRRVVIYLESAGFSVPEAPVKPEKERSDRRPQKRGDRRQKGERRNNDRRDRAPKPQAKPQPLYNDGEKMSTEEVNELVAAYGAKETKEKNQREQPAKFKSFEDYMNSILGDSGDSDKN